jgi:hypothetical protein
MLDSDNHLGHRGQVFDALDDLGLQIISWLAARCPMSCCAECIFLMGIGGRLVDSLINCYFFITIFAGADVAAVAVLRTILQCIRIPAAVAGFFHNYLLNLN